MVYDIIAFILGACVGSFLNVLIVRLPFNQDVIFESSSCPKCNYKLSWYYLIPLLSALYLRFKCDHCHQRFSIQYFMVELLTAITTLLIFQKVGLTLELYTTALLFYTLIVLAFIDLKYKAVPDYLLFIAFILVFVVQYEYFLTSLKDALLFAGAFILLDFIVTFYIQNIKSRICKDESLKEVKALGEGDIPIVAIIGALLGVTSGLFCVFLAAFFAIIPSIYQNIQKKETQTPFIPYLLLGLAVEYFFEISKVII